jgi:hypothetical protein
VILTKEFRQKVLDAVSSERLAKGWDQPAEVLEVYAVELGETNGGLALAVTAQSPLLDDCEHPFEMLHILANEDPQVRSLRRTQLRSEHGIWIGVLFAAETVGRAPLPEMLNLTFVGAAGEWAYMAVGRGVSGADYLPVIFGEDAPASQQAKPGSLLQLLVNVAAAREG